MACVGCLAILFSVGHADGNQRDFRTAFEQFGELGFPDVSSGRLVHVEASQPPYITLSRDNEIQDIPGPSAWLMAAPSNAPAVLIDLFGRPFQLSNLEPEEDSMADETSAPPVLKGTWTDVDLKAYLGALPGFFQALADKPGNDFRYRSSDSGPQVLKGSLFFLAVGLHQTGLTNEAASLASLVLEKSQDPEAFLSACAGILANTAYEAAYAHFVAGGTWAELAHDIKAIRARFGSVWADYEEAGTVMGLAALRAKGPASPPDGLSPHWVRTCLEELMGDQPVDLSELEQIRSYPWVLAPPIGEGAATTGRTPIVRLLDGGMDSIPELLAIATNSTLIRFAPPETGHHYREPDARLVSLLQTQDGQNAMGFSFSSRDELPQPLTLGKLSLMFLEPLVNSTSDKEKLIEDIQNWYGTHKDDTRMELAFHFLKEPSGFYSAKDVAAGILANEGDSRVRARLEQLILDMEDPSETVSLARRYMAFLDREKAGLFRTNLTDVLRQKFALPAANAPESELFVKSDSGRFGRQVDVAELLASLETTGKREEKPALHALLDGCIASNRFELSDSELFSVIQRTPSGDRVPLLTNAILQVKTPALRNTLLQGLVVCKYVREYGEGEGEPFSGSIMRSKVQAPPWRKSTPPVHAASAKTPELPKELSLESLRLFWRIVLTEPATEEWADSRMKAAQTLEFFYNGDRMGYLEPVLLGKTWERLIWERSMKRLEGGPLPDLPTLGKALAFDRTALEKELLAAPEKDLPAALGKLEPEALLSMMTARSLLPELAARFTLSASRVKEADPGLDVESGKPMSTNGIARLIAMLSSTNATGSAVLEIERMPLAAGISVRLKKGGSPDEDLPGFDMQEEMKSNATVIVGKAEAVVFQDKDFRPMDGFLFSVLEEATESPTEADLDERLDSSEDRHSYGYSSMQEYEHVFWELANHLCTATNLPLTPAVIRIRRLPPEARIQRRESEAGGMVMWD